MNIGVFGFVPAGLIKLFAFSKIAPAICANALCLLISAPALTSKSSAFRFSAPALAPKLFAFEFSAFALTSKLFAFVFFCSALLPKLFALTFGLSAFGKIALGFGAELAGFWVGGIANSGNRPNRVRV